MLSDAALAEHVLHYNSSLCLGARTTLTLTVAGQTSLHYDSHGMLIEHQYAQRTCCQVRLGGQSRLSSCSSGNASGGDAIGGFMCDKMSGLRLWDTVSTVSHNHCLLARVHASLGVTGQM